MSTQLKFFMTVLRTVSTDYEQNLHDTVYTLRYPDSLVSQASLLEDVAEATWRVLHREDPTLADSVTIYFLARPFDDGDARLVVIERDHVIFNDCWPLAGTLKDWKDAVTDLAACIRARAVRYPVVSSF